MKRNGKKQKTLRCLLFINIIIIINKINKQKTNKQTRKF